jgi:chromosome segregation ATPase
LDASASQKTIQKLTQENKVLEVQLEGLKKEMTRLQEVRSEISYLEEENADALERITALQEEMKALRETLSKAVQERDQALGQIRTLESRIEQSDLLRIKEKLREREVSHYAVENQEIQARLEESLQQNMDLEKKYEALKKSFHEVKESLTLLRDNCKTNYYNLNDKPE